MSTYYEVRWVNRDKSTSSRSFPTRREAAAYAAGLESTNGKLPKSSARQLLLPRLWERIYERRVNANTKPATLRVVRQAWQRIEKSDLVKRPILRIAAEDVQHVINQHGEFAGKKTLQVFGELFKEAVALGFDGEDWTSGVRARVQPPRNRLFLSVAEVEQLAEKMTVERHQETVKLLAFTGLRVGELAALQVGDWSSATRRLYVQRNASFAGGGKVEIHTTKTKKSERVIPVAPSIAAMLDKAAANRDPGDFLWPSPQGQIWRPGNFRRRSGWRDAVTAIGYPKLRLHDLRHTFASISRQAGADLPTLSRVMGHSSIKVTIDVYSHVYDDELESLAAGLERQFEQKMGENRS
ncbi:tyrosine-type recombinase/integrase [Glutamicibacter ardleyensis]|uniref:tyrosine-type recombinase/integrase n=1 Tax=Glutamicibacter ardleyensis TaxID=225894 RepID=UPI003F90F8EE